MSEIEIFAQGEGISEIIFVRVPSAGTVRDLLAAVSDRMRIEEHQAEKFFVFVEDADVPLDHGASLEAAGVRHRGRVHIHRCRRVTVTINFTSRQEVHPFPPSATIARVHDWACHKFDLADVDAAEHVLQICGTATRPDEDTHLGTLVQHPACAICFDLVAKQRVEG